MGLQGRKCGRTGEEGVILILTLFVILISYALMTQLTIGTTVAFQAVRNSSNRIRLEAACVSAAQEILDTLSDDAAGSGAGASGGLAGNTLGGADASDAGGASAAPGGDGGEDGAEEDSDYDSWEDSWMRPMRVSMGNIQITTWVQDENAKFDLLSLVAADEKFREESRKRCTRILDYLREDFDDDLNASEAQQITDEIVDWLEGKTRSQEYPRPLRYSNPEQEETALMFTTEELLMLEHVDKHLYYDQIEPGDKERIEPGLESVFTVWTQFALDPPGGSGGGGTGAEGGEGGDQAQSLGGGTPKGGSLTSSGGSLGNGSGSGAGQDSQLGSGAASSSGGPLGTRININTAARAVLEGLMPPEELPGRVVEDILEYRNEVDEDALEKKQDLDTDEADLERALYGDEKREPKKVFKSMDDLNKIDSLQNGVPTEVRDKFNNLVDVRSDIFSVYLFARIPPSDWRQEKRYEEPPGPVLRLRAVVWRRQGGDSFVFLMPWQEALRTRWRIPDFQDDLEPFVPPEF